ncbi:MAG: hypothetical protein WB697_18210 [Stellaceae bacterium]
MPRFRFAGLVLAIVLVNIAAGIVSTAEWFGGPLPKGPCALAAWFITIVLLMGCFVVVGRIPPVVDWRGVLIDQRNRISLSRTQLVLWTLLVVSAIITEGTLNAIWVEANPLDLQIPSQLWILLGMSSGSAVAAPVVLGIKADANTLSTNALDQHAWRDMFYGDDTGNDDQVDFSKVQQFFFTGVLVMVYGVQLAMIMLGQPKLFFPTLDNGFIGLMAVSQVAYIAYKALPQNKTNAAGP